MAETKYSRQQIIKFFQALDDLLAEPVSLTIIGGTAMILGYKIDRGTIDEDIDLKYLATIERLFGEQRASAHETLVLKRRS
jgi:hypothetical protein